MRECTDPIAFNVLLVQAPSRLGHEGLCDPPLNTTESRTRENISFIDLGHLGILPDDRCFFTVTAILCVNALTPLLSCAGPLPLGP